MSYVRIGGCGPCHVAIVSYLARITAEAAIAGLRPARSVYLQARAEAQAECILVLIGATTEGKKELVGFHVGKRLRAIWLLGHRRGRGARAFWTKCQEEHPEGTDLPASLLRVGSRSGRERARHLAKLLALSRGALSYV